MKMSTYTINMLSKAEQVSGQGVGSAYSEQMFLMHEYMPDFKVNINSFRSADIIHVHTINPEFRIFIQGRRTPLIGSVHFIPSTLDGSIHLPKPARKVLDWYVINFYQHMHELVTVNPLFVDELVKIGFDRKHVHFLPNHVSEKHFHPISQEQRSLSRRKYNLKEEDFVVLGVGQVQSRKGVKDFIAVASRMPELKFIWAGGFSFGRITEGYDEIKCLVSNPPANVQFTGIVPRQEMTNLYGMANVMFIPSFAELFPMTILEATATEMPFLLRDLPVYSPVLGDNYCKGTNVEEFAEQLDKLRQSNTYNQQAVYLSRELKERYSAPRVAEQWRRLYTSLIEREGKRANT